MMNATDPKQQKRLLWALGLSAVVLLGADAVGVWWKGRTGEVAPIVKADASPPSASLPSSSGPVATSTNSTASVAPSPAAPSVSFGDDDIEGAVSLAGGRINTLKLNKFDEKLGHPDSVSILKPEGPQAEYIQSGWLGAGLKGPGADTLWQQQSVCPQKTVCLQWDNGTGQTFVRTITPRQGTYLVDVIETVFNRANLPVSFSPFVQVNRADGHAKGESSSWVNFFGPMGLTTPGKDEFSLHEMSYSNLKKKGKSDIVQGAGGWWGITGQYFMNVVIPQTTDETNRSFSHSSDAGRDFYTAAVQWPTTVAAPNGSATVRYSLYMGPKQDKILAQTGFQLERAVSWGWFRIIARALYQVLTFFHGYVGNWGIAIALTTLALKLATFPLANRSYHAMAKIKKLAPKMEELKAKYKDDQQALGMAMMDLYKKERVNPASGCWPVLIQIPIFFAMYKVVLVAFEFRHAPLGLWLNDMSAADPYFVLPILMGISMFVQMQLNPQSTDPIQAQVFKWMPVMFTVMFLFFPSGLVFYWLINNIFSIGQQYLIMKKDKAL